MTPTLTLVRTTAAAALVSLLLAAGGCEAPPKEGETAPEARATHIEIVHSHEHDTLEFQGRDAEGNLKFALLFWEGFPLEGSHRYRSAIRGRDAIVWIPEPRSSYWMVHLHRPIKVHEVNSNDPRVHRAIMEFSDWREMPLDPPLDPGAAPKAAAPAGH
ncbi:MAG: hypothetical protein ACYTFT_01840 [Planctomycetota bacterium]|jgi:hypothetical protein